MRRALLTAVKARPRIAGYDSADANAGLTSGFVFADQTFPASATTTLTEVRIGRRASAISVIAFSCSTTFTTITVHDVTTTLSVPAGTGYEVFTVSLPITAGEYLGIYFPVTGQAAPYKSGSGDIAWSSSNSSIFPGASYSITNYEPGTLTISGYA